MTKREAAVVQAFTKKAMLTGELLGIPEDEILERLAEP